MEIRASRARRAIAGVVIAGAAVAGATWWFQSRNPTPSCSWPARIQGTATAQQDGLARCYLRALATRSRGELRVIAQDIPPAHITSGLFRYSPDARAGTATVKLQLSPVDSTFVIVTIRYADGVVENTGMMNMIAMGGPSTWRMALG